MRNATKNIIIKKWGFYLLLKGIKGGKRPANFFLIQNEVLSVVSK
jgi:hypothetical protein